MGDLLLDWFGYWFIRLSAAVIQRLPLGVALAVGRGFAAFVHFFHERRRAAYVNLKAAFPESTARQRKCWTQGMYQNLGMSGIEIFRFPLWAKQDIDRYVTEANYETYLAYRENRKGLVLLTAHMGNWEFSQIVEAIRQRPLTVLARKQKYKRLDQLLNTFREYYGSTSVGKGTGIRDVIRALRRGETVGMLGDQSGGADGIWIRFFGRLTSSPRGPIALALKLGVQVLPVFFVRIRGPYHRLCFEPGFELVRTGDREKDIQVNTQNYIRILEKYLTQHPAQWLWGHKRWKHTRTKRITILSDGKAGHVKQSVALVKEIIAKGKEKTPPYETSIEKIEVQFRSPGRKRIFPFFAFFFIPWAQGRMAWLRFFFTQESVKPLEGTNPDVVISAGASLVPLNLCVAGENLAKTVVLMKPSFPFNLFRYDLALIPAHDQGILPRGTFRTQGALNGMDPETLEASKKALARTLRNPERIRWSLFLGGETRNFRPSLSEIESLLRELERAGQTLGGDYLVTTSRRTPEAISRFLESQLPNHPRCQLCVIASEDKRPEVVPGMMAWADTLLVTEDSLSMISEALSSGKKVVVVKMLSNGLPAKHHRFQEILHGEWGIPVVKVKELSEVLVRGDLRTPIELKDKERVRLREKLETLF